MPAPAVLSERGETVCVCVCVCVFHSYVAMPLTLLVNVFLQRAASYASNSTLAERARIAAAAEAAAWEDVKQAQTNAIAAVSSAGRPKANAAEAAPASPAVPFDV